jgi:hypothetical protein
MIFLILAPSVIRAISRAVKTLFGIPDMVTTIAENFMGENIIGGKVSSYPEFPNYLGEFSDESIFIGLNGLRMRKTISAAWKDQETIHDLLFGNQGSITFQYYSYNVESLKYALAYSEFSVYPLISIRTQPYTPSLVQNDKIYYLDRYNGVIGLLKKLNIKYGVTDIYTDIPILLPLSESITIWNNDTYLSRHFLDISKFRDDLPKNIKLMKFPIHEYRYLGEIIKQKVSSIIHMEMPSLHMDEGLIELWNHLIATKNPKSIEITWYPNYRLIWNNIETLSLRWMDEIQVNQVLQSLNSYARSVKRLELESIGGSAKTPWIDINPNILENLQSLRVQKSQSQVLCLNGFLEIASLKRVEIGYDENTIRLGSRDVDNVKAKIEYISVGSNEIPYENFDLHFSNVKEVTLELKKPLNISFSDLVKVLKLQIMYNPPRYPLFDWPKNMQVLWIKGKETLPIIYEHIQTATRSLREINIDWQLSQELPKIPGFQCTEYRKSNGGYWIYRYSCKRLML